MKQVLCDLRASAFSFSEIAASQFKHGTLINETLKAKRMKRRGAEIAESESQDPGIT